MGRMGYPMAERLLKAGNTVESLEPHPRQGRAAGQAGRAHRRRAGRSRGLRHPVHMVSTGKDLEEVCFGENGVASRRQGSVPKILVDCSSISVEESAAIRAR